VDDAVKRLCVFWGWDVVARFMGMVGTRIGI
jgi:hypothetical protein